MRRRPWPWPHPRGLAQWPLPPGTHFSPQRPQRTFTSLNLFLTLLRTTGRCRAAGPEGCPDRNASHFCWAASFSAPRLCSRWAVPWGAAGISGSLVLGRWLPPSSPAMST